MPKRLENLGSFARTILAIVGYGHAYVVFPFSHMEEFRVYERQARERGLGLWGGKDVKSEPGQARAPTEEHYVSSARSNKYHHPECVWAQKISPSNLVTFKSPEEAQSRGYVPCKVCNPPIASSDKEPAQASVQSPAASTSSNGEETVYVTRTGTKYHRAGCRYLSKSMIPMPLQEAAQRYRPCSVCRPTMPKADR
jgi:hypothetical protein